MFGTKMMMANIWLESGPDYRCKCSSTGHTWAEAGTSKPGWHCWRPCWMQTTLRIKIMSMHSEWKASGLCWFSTFHDTGFWTGEKKKTKRGGGGVGGGCNILDWLSSPSKSLLTSTYLQCAKIANLLVSAKGQPTRVLNRKSFPDIVYMKMQSSLRLRCIYCLPWQHFKMIHDWRINNCFSAANASVGMCTWAPYWTGLMNEWRWSLVSILSKYQC